MICQSFRYVPGCIDLVLHASRFSGFNWQRVSTCLVTCVHCLPTVLTFECLVLFNEEMMQNSHPDLKVMVMPLYIPLSLSLSLCLSLSLSLSFSLSLLSVGDDVCLERFPATLQEPAIARGCHESGVGRAHDCRGDTG